MEVHRLVEVAVQDAFLMFMPVEGRRESTVRIMAGFTTGEVWSKSIPGR
jgi:hypothetical protein